MLWFCGTCMPSKANPTTEEESSRFASKQLLTPPRPLAPTPPPAAASIVPAACGRHPRGCTAPRPPRHHSLHCVGGLLLPPAWPCCPLTNRHLHSWRHDDGRHNDCDALSCLHHRITTIARLQGVGGRGPKGRRSWCGQAWCGLRDVAQALGVDEFLLLNVRLPWERAHTAVRGSVHVPLFIADEDMCLVTVVGS